MKKVFSTLDAYQAGFLTLKGHQPTLSEQGNKIVFLFEANKSLYKDLTAYNSGALVEALRFALAVKGLKGQIFSLRMNNEKRYGEKKEVEE